MAGWLFFSGAVSLSEGMLLFFSVELLRKLSDIFDRPIFYLDDKLKSASVLVGMILCLAGGWVISTAFAYSALWFLKEVGAFILGFGLIYLFAPGWLGGISRTGDRLLISTDKEIYNARKTIGIILIMSSLYIFYGALLII